VVHLVLRTRVSRCSRIDKGKAETPDVEARERRWEKARTEMREHGARGRKGPDAWVPPGFASRRYRSTLTRR
jgi:hypothetical protein